MANTSQVRYREDDFYPITIMCKFMYLNYNTYVLTIRFIYIIFYEYSVFDIKSIPTGNDQL